MNGSASTESGDVAGFRPVTEAIPEVAPAPYLDALRERFGFPQETFAHSMLFQPNSKCLSIVDRRVLIPIGTKPLAVGMPFLYINMHHPRLTTAATVLVGAAATRNRIDLDDPEVHDFVARKEFPLRPEQEASCTGPGYAIGCHDGIVLGLGVIRRVEERLLVLGTLPRSWASRWQTAQADSV